MHKDESGGRLAKAVHGLRKQDPDPAYVIGLAEDLRRHYGPEGLVALYGRFGQGYETFDGLMRRVLWRALSRSCGDGLVVEQGVGFKHPETFEIGKGVFIGAHSFIQGRFDGCCRIGDYVWIGPQSYFDARDLVLERREHRGFRGVPGDRLQLPNDRHPGGGGAAASRAAARDARSGA